MRIKIAVLFIISTFLASCAPSIKLAENPKVASYWTSPTMSKEDAKSLARFHLLIVDMENLINNPRNLRLIKKLNPQIKILAYSNPMEIWVPTVKDRPLGKELADKMPDEWRLKTPDGKPMVFWKGMEMLNLSTTCPEINGLKYNRSIAQFLLSRVLSDGIWDGYFMDNSGGNISWMNNGFIDADNNGIKDDSKTLDGLWSDGIEEFLNIIRTAKGPKFILIGNKGSTEFLDVLDGKMFEEFPNNYFGDKRADGWYQCKCNYDQTGPMSIVHAKRNSPEKRLFVLASALMGDGYFAYGQNSSSIYDEYREIGLPLGPAMKNDDGSWSRQFSLATVNVWPEQKRGEIKYQEK